MHKFLFLFLVILMAGSCQSSVKVDPTNDSTPNRKWWKEAVVYQIYPRSFKDSNGDGIGDLKGIISKLDYIKNLGVDVVWLNPVLPSDMQDFDSLASAMRARGIRLVLNRRDVPDSIQVSDPKGSSLLEFKNMFARGDWDTLCLSNHDQPRMLTRWGNDSLAFRVFSSKMLSTFMLTMPATPYYYFGDELGMTDNSRTPFQWDTTGNAGFSSGKPWLKVNPNFKTVNEAAEDKDSASTLTYFRKLVRLRKQNLVLVYGKYALVDKDNPDVYAYTRELNGRRILVVLNVRSRLERVNTAGLDLSHASILIGNYATPSPDENLRPYEAVVYELDR